MSLDLEKYLPRHAASRARLDARHHLELHGLPVTMQQLAVAALQEQDTANAVWEHGQAGEPESPFEPYQRLVGELQELAAKGS